MTLALYIVGGVFLYFYQTQIIYWPAKKDFSICPELFSDGFKPVIKKVGKYTLRFYEKDRNQKATLVFLHGKSGSICSRHGLFTGMPQSLPVNFILLEYPGFSNDQTPLKKETIDSYVDAFLNDYIKTNPSKKVIPYGESLGTAFAVRIGAHFPEEVEALILQTPYTSLAQIAQYRYPIYPVRWMLKESFEPVLDANQLKQKVLIYHSRDDQTIPIQFAKEFAKSATNADVKFVEYQGIGHAFYYRKQPEKLYPMLESFIKEVLEK